MIVLRPREGGPRPGENFWLRVTTASAQCLRLSERFFILSFVIQLSDGISMNKLKVLEIKSDSEASCLRTVVGARALPHCGFNFSSSGGCEGNTTRVPILVIHYGPQCSRNNPQTCFQKLVICLRCHTDCLIPPHPTLLSSDKLCVQQNGNIYLLVFSYRFVDLGKKSFSL